VQAGRCQAAKQLLSDPPRRVMVACEALEAEGFRIANNLETFGRYVLIECHLPLALRYVMTPDNPHYQQIIDYAGDCVRRCLKRARVDADVHPTGWRLTIWLPMSRKPRPKGRPRENPSFIAQAKRYLNDGLSYVALAKIMGENHHEHKSADAWRKLIPHSERTVRSVKKRK